MKKLIWKNTTFDLVHWNYLNFIKVRTMRVSVLGIAFFCENKILLKKYIKWGETWNILDVLLNHFPSQ